MLLLPALLEAGVGYVGHDCSMLWQQAVIVTITPVLNRLECHSVTHNDCVNLGSVTLVVDTQALVTLSQHAAVHGCHSWWFNQTVNSCIVMHDQGTHADC